MPREPEPPDDPQVDKIVKTLRGHGGLTRERLAEMTHASAWEPGSEFRQALDRAEQQGYVRKLDGDVYVPADEQ